MRFCLPQITRNSLPKRPVIELDLRPRTSDFSNAPLTSEV